MFKVKILETEEEKKNYMQRDIKSLLNRKNQYLLKIIRTVY